MAEIEIIEKDDSATFAVRVIPRSSKTEIVGEHNGALKIKLKPPPVDGAANEELIRYLSKLFDVSRSKIEIVSGETSRSKRIRIADLSRSDIDRFLQGKI